MTSIEFETMVELANKYKEHLADAQYYVPVAIMHPNTVIAILTSAELDKEKVQSVFITQNEMTFFCEIPVDVNQSAPLYKILFNTIYNNPNQQTEGNK